jgi:Phage terminase, small subunit
VAQLAGPEGSARRGSSAARLSGRSRSERDERAQQVFEALSADAPLRDADGGLPAADTMVVHLLARCLVRLERVERWLADYGALDERTGAPKPATELEGRLRREALDYARELGLTPKARAALGVDLQRAFDLARHWAEEADP